MRNFFDNPGETITELDVLRAKMADLLHRGAKVREAREAILIAAQLEFFMLNPAFEILFHFMKQDAGGHSPEDDYDVPLHKFSQFFHRHAEASPEYELLGEMLGRMWSHSRSCASQLSQIRTLRGLIPMCAGCKKIRDDQGFWQQVETYLGEQIGAEFTHGLCPNCIEKLYAEYDDLVERRKHNGNPPENNAD